MWVSAVSLRVKGIAPGKTCRLSINDEPAVKCLSDSDIKVYPGADSKVLIPVHTIDGYCRGKGLDEPCNTHYECDVGLMCGIEKKCANAAEEGEYCNRENSLCKSYLYCRAERCIKYGSTKNHMNPGTNDPDLCESRYIYRGVCAPAPRLNGKIIVDNVEHICDYDNGSHEFARCGFHKDPKAICSARRG